ncbi:MAG: hypothetical protein ACM3O3_12975 [Syntrophothermus sp.]
MSKFVTLKVSEIVSFRNILFQVDCVVDTMQDESELFNELIGEIEVPDNIVKTRDILKEFNKKLDNVINTKIKGLKDKSKEIKSYSVSIKEKEISALRELNLLDEFLIDCTENQLIENCCDLQESIEELNKTVERIILK